MEQSQYTKDLLTGQMDLAINLHYAYMMLAKQTVSNNTIPPDYGLVNRLF